MSDLKNYGTATIKYIQENGSRDMELIIPYNQEIVNIDGRYILRDKKPQYPKTYDECLKILGYNIAHIIPMNHGHNGLLMMKLQRLLIFRDAYWKIAGNELELGKPWEQDYDDRCFIIANNNGDIHTYEYHGSDNVILAFPTEEMRDNFYDNFKDLIESCKELL